MIAPGAIDLLGEHAARHGWREALVVADQNTLDAAGSRVTAALGRAGAEIHTLVFPERQGLLAGPQEVSAVRGRLGGAAHTVAVGSGVITDIVRYAAHLGGRDFVSVPTAASMDGYASSVAALQLDGVKVTYPARAPKAIFAEPAIVAAAPPELTRAGIGDLLAKATARVDWLAAHLLYDEPYREDVAALVLGPLSFAAANVDGVLSGGVEEVSALLVGLVDSGIAMALAGDSRPASGCEHHASHFWDLLAARGRRPHHPHGLQVGYAAHFAMRLQRFAFAGGVPWPPKRPVVVGEPLGPAAREWLGEPSQEMVGAVEEKRRFVAEHDAHWPVGRLKWDAVRGRLGEALEIFPSVELALEQAGIPRVAGYLDVGEDTLRATFRYASRLRARYTAIDFLEGQGLLDDAIDTIITGAR